MKAKAKEPSYPWVMLRLADEVTGYFNARMIMSVRSGRPGTTIINDQWLREQMVFEAFEDVCDKLGITKPATI